MCLMRRLRLLATPLVIVFRHCRRPGISVERCGMYQTLFLGGILRSESDDFVRYTAACCPYGRYLVSLVGFPSVPVLRVCFLIPCLSTGDCMNRKWSAYCSNLTGRSQSDLTTVDRFSGLTVWPLPQVRSSIGFVTSGLHQPVMDWLVGRKLSIYELARKTFKP